MIRFKNQQEKKLNDAIMARMDALYDENEKMITQYRGEHGYHSTLVNQWVHTTNGSLGYAYERMNRGEEGDFKEAQAILRRVVPLQDTDPAHDTYGIWSYFMEEPLDKMAPPDWNWADFCGKELLHIFMEHGERLDADVREMVRQAVIHCCNSIRRRDMGPHYTNISIMGALITMAAGEAFSLESLIAYAKKRIDTLYEFNMSHGAFQEYNSPSYTWVVVDNLAALMPYIKDEDCRKKFQDINDLAWRCIAEHYHYQTKQWAGPHSRFYAMLEDTQLLMRIQRALDYRIQLVSLDEEGLADKLPMGFFSSDSVCPAQYAHYFTEPTKEAEVDAVFVYGNCPADREIAVCRQKEAYNLGTFYKSTFWNQRRNHISYFGTEEKPVYCGMKCLHDFYDYSSGLMVTAQDGMRTISAVGFGTDGGDTHPSLDMVKDASIEAFDLRIRFEIGGAVDKITAIQEEEGRFLIDMGGEKIRIVFPYAKFGDNPISYTVTEEKEHINETGDHKHTGAIIGIDAILYHGEAKKICFTDLEECCCGVAFEIAAEGESFAGEITAGVMNGRLWVEQDHLRVEAPSAACTMSRFREEAKAYRGGKEYLEIYTVQ